MLALEALFHLQILPYPEYQGKASCLPQANHYQKHKWNLPALLQRADWTRPVDIGGQQAV